MGTKESSIELSLSSLLGSGAVGMRMLIGGAAVGMPAVVICLTAFHLRVVLQE